VGRTILISQFYEIFGEGRVTDQKRRVLFGII